jgi:glycosyltransferase involved in cell wall biosynthesis
VHVLEIPAGRAPALAGLGAAWRSRRELRAGMTVHLEFGSNDLEVFWFGLAAVTLRRDCVVVAHDYPKLAHAPAAALIPTSSRWLRAVAYRVLSPALDRLVVRMLIRRSGVLAVFGEEARRAWLAEGARHVEAIFPGSDPPTDERVPPSQGESVLFAGFLSPHKGLDTLLDAWSEVGGLTELPLLIAGAAEPAHERWAEELARRATALTNAPRFLGRVAEERAFQELFDRAAVVVLPYRFSSPVSGVLVRAMAAGRPVITTPVPAARASVLDGRNGMLVPAEDPDRLAEALLTLARSPDERDRLGAAARHTALERFSWNRYVEGLERAYDRAERGP